MSQFMMHAFPTVPDVRCMTGTPQDGDSGALQLLALSGSLRAASLNTAMLSMAIACTPPGLEVKLYPGLGDLPLFNPDIEAQELPTVARLLLHVAIADALLIASPEYNFSISGVLKNAIDWMTRIPVQPFKDKPVALISATGGPVGGARHQYELRKVLGSQDALVLTRPEIFIGACYTRFDASGKLIDEATRKILADQMLAFESWIARLARV